MKLPFKKGKEVVFQKVKSQKGFTLENQDGKLTDFGDVDIEDYLDDMFHTPDQFVILTAPKPQNKVRYVQACALAALTVRRARMRFLHSVCIPPGGFIVTPFHS